MAGKGKQQTSGREASAVDVRGAGGELHLVRDLLDTQLVDNRHDPLGRADGVILTVVEGHQPRVACIEIGVTVASGRVSRRIGMWVRALARRWGLRRGRPTRVPWSRVKKVAIETELDLLADQTPALAWENWLRERVVRRIPSLKPKNKEKHGEEKHDEGEPEKKQ
jgi:hypothetical protein